VTCSPDIAFGEAGLDAAYNMTFAVVNDGEQGEVQILPRISTSEGEWRRSQTLVMEKGERRTFSYTFPEPSISATNVQCEVNTLP
jgi:hypothetical protein